MHATNIDMHAILDAMLKKAEEVYKNSEEDYPKTRGKRGFACVKLRYAPNQNRWIAVEDVFGEKSYRNTRTQNGREIEYGANFEGVVQGKIAYCKRTGENSGTSIRDIKEGESFWKGAIFDGADKMALFGYSGFNELDDIVVGEAGREEYLRQVTSCKNNNRS